MTTGILGPYDGSRPVLRVGVPLRQAEESDPGEIGLGRFKLRNNSVHRRGAFRCSLVPVASEAPAYG